MKSGEPLVATERPGHGRLEHRLEHLNETARKFGETAQEPAWAKQTFRLRQWIRSPPGSRSSAAPRSRLRRRWRAFRPSRWAGLHHALL